MNTKNVDYQDIVKFVNFLCGKEYRLLGQPPQ